MKRNSHWLKLKKYWRPLTRNLSVQPANLWLWGAEEDSVKAYQLEVKARKSSLWQRQALRRQCFWKLNWKPFSTLMQRLNTAEEESRSLSMKAGEEPSIRKLKLSMKRRRSSSTTREMKKKKGRWGRAAKETELYWNKLRLLQRRSQSCMKKLFNKTVKKISRTSCCEEACIEAENTISRRRGHILTIKEALEEEEEEPISWKKRKLSKKTEKRRKKRREMKARWS